MTEEELERFYAQVLELSQNIPRCERLADADATVTMVSPLCGSQVSVDLKLVGGGVVDYGQKVRACALGAVAASVMGRNIVGKRSEELRALRDTMRRMLKEDGPPPDGEWSSLALLEPARDLVSRHGSIMLAFDAVIEALDEVEGNAGPEPRERARGIPDTVRA